MAAIARLLILLAWLLPTAAAADGTAPRRVALVIGNGGYQHTIQLQNPPNDARAVAQKLRELGFDVVEGIDLDQSGMRARLAAFARQLEGADAALFYYAGHGLPAGDRHSPPPVGA